MEVRMPTPTIATLLEPHRSQPHQLIEALQDVQKHYGYVSEDSMKAISNELGVPLLEVYSVASFYKSFSLQPRGKNIVTVCTGTACHVRGAKMVLNQAVGQIGVAPGEISKDGLFTIEHVNCLGACALGPVVTENESIHHHMNPGKLRKLIKSIHKDSKEETSHA
jgi:NADH:ubiquinone oxidoreductase subunit E